MTDPVTTSATARKSVHGLWSSRLAFILAATGSAVGLGNIWKFPYLVGENGGGAFVLVYLICIFLVGIPIMMAEIMLGRRGRQNPVNTMKTLAREEGAEGGWRFIGGMGIITGFLVLSFYSVIAGWALAYVFRMMGGAFEGASVEEVSTVFSALTGDAERLILWHTVFMVLTAAIVARGVSSGLEKATRILMPALLLLLFLLLLYAASTGAFMDGLTFLFNPDFSKLTSESVLKAIGLAFFSLSIGLGGMMMYGAYLPDNISITKASVIVAMADTSIALLAGMIIFPIVLSNGLEPAQGPGLVFNTLPLAFGQMSGGILIGTLFFTLLVFAALTSAISLLEPAVAWFIEKRNKTRFQAAVVCSSIVWFLGLGTVFSFNLWADYTWTFKLDLGIWQRILWKDKSFFDIVDFLTSNIMMLVGGLFIAIFVAYVMKRETVADELKLGEQTFEVWHFVLRYITPLAVLIILFNSIGIDILGFFGLY